MSLEKFETLVSAAVPLPIENIDTDQIIPARFLKAVERKGFDDNLFRDWRYDKLDNEVASGRGRRGSAEVSLRIRIIFGGFAYEGCVYYVGFSRARMKQLSPFIMYRLPPLPRAPRSR